MRIAVIGHVEHVTIGRVPALPGPGDIAHLDTAIGGDEAGAQVAARLAATRAHVHAARRDEPHTRDVVLITPDGERTIVVVGEPLHPRRSDPLPWDLLATCDAAYFTAQDP